MAKLRHGQTKKTPLYAVWSMMRQRCNNPRNKDYADYGARGITIDPRWDDFALFLQDLGERPDGYTLERRDNNAGYSLDNCYWATRLEQVHNRRDNVWIEFGGQRMTLSEWAREIGISAKSLSGRLAHWSTYKALTTPPLKGGTRQ